MEYGIKHYLAIDTNGRRERLDLLLTGVGFLCGVGLGSHLILTMKVERSWLAFAFCLPMLWMLVVNGIHHCMQALRDDLRQTIWMRDNGEGLEVMLHHVPSLFAKRQIKTALILWGSIKSIELESILGERWFVRLRVQRDGRPNVHIIDSPRTPFVGFESQLEQAIAIKTRFAVLQRSASNKVQAH